MPTKQYPIAKPHITKKEEQYVLETLRSGVLSMGEKINKFEENFAKLAGTRYACAVSSGTAGLHLALIAAGIGQGDEVITTPFSFIASANSIMYVGATPVFVDIDPSTYNMDPQKIKEKITKKTKAILVVHIFGQPADMDPIIKIAKKYNLKIIGDACESIGSYYKGRPIGTFGEAAVFAFYPNKQITTGEGGVVATNNKKIDELCRSLRNQGRTKNMQWLDHMRLGYNYRMDELSAAIGLAQLEKLYFIIRQRRTLAGWYSAYFAKYPELLSTPIVANYNTHTWFVYVIKIRNKKINRNKIINTLAKKKIQTKPYLPSIHLFNFYKKKYGYTKGDYPIAEGASAYTLALPLYVGLTKNDIMLISRNVIETLHEHEK